MTKYIAVISGKGGVGKTTVTINIATALTGLGRRIVLVDADLHTPNVGLYLGVPLLPKTSFEAIKGKESILNVSYLHSSGLNIIPSKIHVKELSKDCFTSLAKKLSDLQDAAEIVFVDMPSGLSSDLRILLEKCDYSLIVTTPDFPAVTNALKAISLSQDLDVSVLGVVVNKTTGASFEMSEKEIEAMLGERVLISIPDEKSIREAVYLRSPVVYSHPDSESAEQFKKLALSLLA